MDDRELSRKAADLGLDKVVSNHADNLRKALGNGAALSGKLPRDLKWMEEPAHIFTLVRPEKKS